MKLLTNIKIQKIEDPQEHFYYWDLKMNFK